MAVNRQLRDEIDRLFFIANCRKDYDTMVQLLDLLESDEKNTTMRDDGAHDAAIRLLTGNWDVWYENDWTDHTYQKNRRAIAFLRSDIDYVESTPPDMPARLHFGRLCILVIWILVTVLVMCLLALKVGAYGFLLWLASAIPMFIGHHIRQKYSGRHSSYAPFKSLDQYRAHEHLADRPPALPTLKEMNPTYGQWPGWRIFLDRLWRAALVYLLYFIAAIYVASIWPLMLYDNWVMDKNAPTKPRTP